MFKSNKIQIFAHQIGVFKGFLSRTFNAYSKKYLNKEISFLIEIFTEIGHSRTKLKKNSTRIPMVTGQNPFKKKKGLKTRTKFQCC